MPRHKLIAAPLTNSAPDTPAVKFRKFKNTVEERAALLDRKNRQLQRNDEQRIPHTVDPDFALLVGMSARALARAERTGRHDDVTRTIAAVGLDRLRAGDKAALSAVSTAFLDALASDWHENCPNYYIFTP